MNALMTHSFELKKCKINIKTCSKIKSNVNCNYFLRFIETNEKLVANEIQKLRTMSNRPKRFLTVITLVYVWIKQWLTDDGIDQKIVDQLQEENKKNRELTEQHLRITNTTIELQNKVYHKLKESIYLLQNEIIKIENVTTDTYYLAGLSNVITETLSISKQFYKTSFR